MGCQTSKHRQKQSDSQSSTKPKKYSTDSFDTASSHFKQNLQENNIFIKVSNIEDSCCSNPQLINKMKPSLNVSNKGRKYSACRREKSDIQSEKRRFSVLSRSECNALKISRFCKQSEGKINEIIAQKQQDIQSQKSENNTSLTNIPSDFMESDIQMPNQSKNINFHQEYLGDYIQ